MIWITTIAFITAAVLLVLYPRDKIRKAEQRLRDAEDSRDHYAEIARFKEAEALAESLRASEAEKTLRTYEEARKYERMSKMFCTYENGLTTPGCPTHDANGELL